MDRTKIEYVAQEIAKIWISENKNANLIQAGILFQPSAEAAIKAILEWEKK